MTRKPRKAKRHHDVGARSITGYEGSPVHAVRWKPSTWKAIYDLVGAHSYHPKAKANHVAQVAVKWGLYYIEGLSRTEQRRILGIEKELTIEELERFRADLSRKLSSRAGLLRLDDRLGFALPRPMKDDLRDEKERTGVSMGRQIRQVLSSNPAKNRSVRSQSVS